MPDSTISRQSAERFLASSQEVFIATDEKGEITAWSKGAERAFGWPADRVTGRQLIETIFPPEERAARYRSFNYFMATGRGDEFEGQITVTVIDSQGHSFPAEMAITPLESDGRYYFHVFLRDVSEAKAVADQAERLNAAIAGAKDAIVSVDRSGEITDWNLAAEKLFGYSRQEIIGRALQMVFPDDGGERLRALQQAIGDGVEFRCEATQRSRDGQEIEVEISSHPLRGNEEQLLGATVFIRDISDRKRTERQLAYMTDHDALTGLHNRRRFSDEIEERLAQSADGGIGGALILIDVDNFKLINDSYGHDVGDDVLRTVAKTLEDHAGELDEIAHFGRDEFALLLHGADREQAEAMAAAIRDAVPEEIWRNCQVQATLSVGIAVFEAGEERNVEELMVAADTALFEAKELGHGKVLVYDPSRTSRFSWAERIRRALSSDGLALYGQPIMDIKTEEIVQQELLLRMHDSDGAVVEPAPFLATAERLGLIGDIDRWVIHRGLEIAAEGQAVEINLSGHSLTDSGLIELIARELQESGADPEKVIFEITETAAISNLSEATTFAQRLRELGCQFALDDFGTGFASFTYLKHLPISVLKIDGEFIANLISSEIDQRIVQAIVFIAQGLGQKTVAEWVDDQRTLEKLREIGVDYAQGYYVGRPAPLPGQPIKSTA